MKIWAEHNQQKPKPKLAKLWWVKITLPINDGRRSYRRKAGLKPNDGKAVHHKDGDSKDNKRSNLQVYKNKGPQRAAHEKKHERQKNFKKSGGRKTPKRGYVAKEMKGKRWKRMPRGDRTGPNGEGPNTGRGAGPCPPTKKKVVKRRPRLGLGLGRRVIKKKSK